VTPQSDALKSGFCPSTKSIDNFLELLILSIYIKKWARGASTPGPMANPKQTGVDSWTITRRKKGACHHRKQATLQEALRLPRSPRATSIANGKK
jgi:hypothetical protein